MFRTGFGYKPDFIVVFSECFVCAYFVSDNHICAFFGKLLAGIIDYVIRFGSKPDYNLVFLFMAKCCQDIGVFGELNS